MRKVARYLSRYTYDRVSYEPIRGDFLRWYVELYETLDPALNSENSHWVTMAIDSATDAQQFEPDTPLHTAINVLEGVEETVAYFCAWCSILSLLGALCLFSVGSLNFVPEYLPKQSTISTGLGAVLLIPTLTYPLYFVISRTLQMDIEVIQQYNQELVIPTGRIREDERYPVNLVSYYIWHSSLCSTNKQPIIVILGIIRRIWPRAYGYISYRITENMKEYRDDNVLKLIGREYQLFKHERKRREQKQPK